MNQPTIQQLNATEKAYMLRSQSKNDNELAKKLQLSKVTLYTRLDKSNWTDAEILYLEYIYNPSFFIFVDELNIIQQNPNVSNKSN